ncbi:MAG: hypothetical protein KF712_16245 [Akkermansiaceae bacterium]|nr:hypothetical protein [Akkermansiaceae bacterium]
METITLEQIIQPELISAAFERLRRNDGSPGEDALTIRDLGEAMPTLWPATVEALRNGTYQPAPLRPVSIPKPTGGTRKLAIPSVLDRLIQHAITAALTPPWEARFPPAPMLTARVPVHKPE